VGTEDNPGEISKSIFLEEVLRLENNFTYLGVDHKENIFAGRY
jgi:hypothetical protein